MGVTLRSSTIVEGSTNVGYKISTDLLSLYVDINNYNSYPNSGNIWYDLSSGTHDISTTLATYNSTSPASFGIVGNGTPIIDFTASAPTSVFTIETVIKPTLFPNVYNIFLNFGSAAFRIYIDNGGSLFYWPGSIPSSSIATYVVDLNQWQYFVFEMYDGQIPANNKLYKNGDLLTTTGGTNPLTPTSYNDGMGQIFGDMKVSCSIFRTYNRALTQQEITNNYNYLKPIYSLA